MAKNPSLAVRIGSCTPESLAMLGPMLCMYRAIETHVLAGLAAAAIVRPWVSIGADGPCEALTFFDRAQRPCWQLFLLPDSDYYAWERVVAGLSDPLPINSVARTDPGERNGIRRRVGNPLWRACALQVHAVAERNSPCRLAAAQVLLSEAGQRAAQRIAQTAGASFPVVDVAVQPPVVSLGYPVSRLRRLPPSPET